MKSEPAKLGWKPSLTFYGCFFIFMFLLALDGLRSAELAASGRGFPLHLVIAVPWVFGAILGAGLWFGGGRGRFDRGTAGSILFALGFIISAAYEAMGKLSAPIH